jgi:hypothetical protein
MATSSESQHQQLLAAIGSDRNQNTSGRFGGIVSYDRYTNTATVIISKQNSNQVEQVLKNVQCPVITGLQAVSPSPGKPCWVVFKDGNINQPLITHFFNHEYAGNEYGKQNGIGFSIPSFMMR